MSDRNWDKELSKIDRRLESISDEALFPTKYVEVPVARAEAAAAQQKTRTFGAVLRLLLATALGVGMLFWPYDARCGVGLAGYLAAVGVLVGAGVWSAVWTWRHRTSHAHVLSLLLIAWGVVLAAVDVLPRSGYARPDIEHPAIWACE